MRLWFVLTPALMSTASVLAEPEPAVDGPRVEVMRVHEGEPTEGHAEDAEQAEVMHRLQTPVELGRGSLGFEEALDALRTQAGVKIIVNWPACEIPGIDRDTWVQVDADGLAARAVLGFLLEIASSNAFEDDKLGYCIRDGAVFISTLREIKAVTENRVYNIAPLLIEPFRPVGLMHEADAFEDTVAFHAWRRGQRSYPFTDPVRLAIYKQHVEEMQAELEALVDEHGMPDLDELEVDPDALFKENRELEDGLFGDRAGQPQFTQTYEERIEHLIELIQDTVGSQDEWLDDDSSVREIGGRLVIKTTRANHHEIEALLNTLLEQEVEDQADILRDAQVMRLLHRASELQLEGEFFAGLEVAERALLIDPDHITARAMQRVLSETVERMDAAAD